MRVVERRRVEHRPKGDGSAGPDGGVLLLPGQARHRERDACHVTLVVTSCGVIYAGGGSSSVVVVPAENDPAEFRGDRTNDNKAKVGLLEKSLHRPVAAGSLLQIGTGERGRKDVKTLAAVGVGPGARAVERLKLSKVVAVEVVRLNENR